MGDIFDNTLMTLALGGLAVSLALFASAWLYPHLRRVWDKATALARAVFCGAVAVACLYGGAKPGGTISYPKTDNDIAYLTDAGSYVTNDAVHVAFTRLPMVPSSATFYLDYCALDGTNEQGVATNWVNAKTATFGELSVPFDFAFANATNYNWLAYTDWTPGPAVQTNGVWHAYWGLDRKQGRYFIPVRTCVRDGSEVIATPKSKAEAFYANCVAWVADDAAAGLADGATVSAWTSNDGRKASKTAGAPTIALNVFNGHAALDFNGSSRFTIADNPIYGQSDFAVAIVAKARTYYTGSIPGWYNANMIFGFDLPSCQNDWGICVYNNGKFSMGWGNTQTSRGDFNLQSSVSAADASVHVIIGTMSQRDSTNTITVDGATTSTKFSVLAERVMKNIYIGFTERYFDGQIAEIRIYRDCNLTDAQRNLIGSKLATKYGATWKTE